MWRAFLCLIVFDEKRYTRSIASFRKQPATFIIEYDASLTGLGVIVHPMQDGIKGQIKVWSSIQFPFDTLKNSSFQNTCEYLAVVAGMLLLYAEGIHDFVYDVTGDSVASLTWCKKDHASSILAKSASIGLNLLSITMNAQVGEATHIAGHLNVACDSLSRNKTIGLEELTIDAEASAGQQASIVVFLKICDPTKPITTSAELINVLSQFLLYLS